MSAEPDERLKQTFRITVVMLVEAMSMEHAERIATVTAAAVQYGTKSPRWMVETVGGEREVVTFGSLT